MQFISVTDQNENWIVVHVTDYRAYEAGTITLEQLANLAAAHGDRFSWPTRDATRAAIEAENADDPAPGTRTRRSFPHKQRRSQ